MNISKFLTISFLLIPLSTIYAQTEDIIFEDAELISREETPPFLSKFACKTCDDYWVISDFDEGIRAVKNRIGKIGFINVQEKLIIPLVYSTYYEIDKNRIIVSNDSSKKGIIDFHNKVIVPLEFDNIKKNVNLSYNVSKNNKIGVLDENGVKIIPIEYKAILFKNGYYFVNINEKSGVLNINGEVHLKPIYTSIEKIAPYYYIYQTSENSNVIDIITRKKLLKGKYTKLAPSYSRLLLANVSNKMGLINFSEEVLIPFDYDIIKPFYRNLYLVNKNKHYGIYDLVLKAETIPTKYENITDMKGGFRLKRDGKYGFAQFAKKELKIVLPIEYDNIYKMDDRVLRLTKDNKYGLLNTFSNKIVVPVVYDKIEASYLSNSSFYLAYANKKITILSAYYFKPIINKEFDSVKYKNDFLVCSQNNLYYLYTPTGFAYLEQLDDLVILNPTLVKVQKEGKWGIYSAGLKGFIVPCEHDKLYFDATKNIFKIGDENYKIIGNKLIKQ